MIIKLYSQCFVYIMDFLRIISLFQIHTIFVVVRLFHDDGLLLTSALKMAIWGQNGVDISCELITYAMKREIKDDFLSQLNSP